MLWTFYRICIHMEIPLKGHWHVLLYNVSYIILSQMDQSTELEM